MRPIPKELLDMDQFERKRAMLADKNEQVEFGIKANRDIEYQYKNIKNYFSDKHQKLDPWEFIMEKFCRAADPKNKESSTAEEV